MAVNPLDLQTNFVQVSNVGKQQALAKEQEVLRQDHVSEHLDKTSEKDSDDVPETKKLLEENKVKNEKKQKEKKENKKEIKKKTDEKEEDEDEKLKLHNPEVGQNIDLLG